MISQRRRKLVIGLIKKDLLNCKMINGLSHMGIEAGAYYMFLSNFVFKLMGFKKKERTDELYDLYIGLSRKSESLPLDAEEEFDRLAKEIYEALVKKK